MNWKIFLACNPANVLAAEMCQSQRVSSSKLLPNGLKVQHLSGSDLPFIYDEIFVRQCYMQHGVAIKKGATVLDIGSNIGLFSLWAASEAGQQGHVVALEPLPVLHGAMVHNIASHREWCAGRDSTPAQVTALQIGAGDGSHNDAQFTLYTSASGWSTMVPDASETQDNMRIFLRAALAEPRKDSSLGSGVMPIVGALLLRWIPSRLFDILSRWYVGRMLAAATTVKCPLTTISEVMSLHNLREVDLLKIDVERAELAVLNGIKVEDWKRVKQTVLEVHDTPPGRLQEVLDLLQGPAAFTSVVAEQSPALEGSSLWNVWAMRQLS